MPGTRPVCSALVTAWQPGRDFSEIFIYFYLQLAWVFVAACRLSSSCGKQGLLPAAVGGLLTATASRDAEQRLQGVWAQRLWFSGARAQRAAAGTRLRCPAARGILWTRG